MAQIKLFSEEQIQQMVQETIPVDFNSGYNYKKQDQGPMFVQVNVFDENNSFITSLYSNKKAFKLPNGKIWVGDYHTIWVNGVVEYYEGVQLLETPQRKLVPIVKMDNGVPVPHFQFKIYKDVSTELTPLFSDTTPPIGESLFIKPNEVLALLTDAENETGPVRITESTYRIETNILEDVFVRIGQHGTNGVPVTWTADGGPV